MSAKGWRMRKVETKLLDVPSSFITGGVDIEEIASGHLEDYRSGFGMLKYLSLYRH